MSLVTEDAIINTGDGRLQVKSGSSISIINDDDHIICVEEDKKIYVNDGQMILLEAGDFIEVKDNYVIDENVQVDDIILEAGDAITIIEDLATRDVLRLFKSFKRKINLALQAILNRAEISEDEDFMNIVNSSEFQYLHNLVTTNNKDAIEMMIVSRGENPAETMDKIVSELRDIGDDRLAAYVARAIPRTGLGKFWEFLKRKVKGDVEGVREPTSKEWATGFGQKSKNKEGEEENTGNFREKLPPRLQEYSDQKLIDMLIAASKFEGKDKE